MGNEEYRDSIGCDLVGKAIVLVKGGPLRSNSESLQHTLPIINTSSRCDSDLMADAIQRAI